MNQFLESKFSIDVYEIKENKFYNSLPSNYITVRTALFFPAFTN